MCVFDTAFIEKNLSLFARKFLKPVGITFALKSSNIAPLNNMTPRCRDKAVISKKN